MIISITIIQYIIMIIIQISININVFVNDNKVEYKLFVGKKKQVQESVNIYFEYTGYMYKCHIY